MINFFVYYAIDSNLSAHVLTLEMYGGVNAGCWVLLEAEGGVAEADPVEGWGGAPFSTFLMLRGL